MNTKTENSASSISYFNFSGEKIFLFQPRDAANTNFTPVPYGLASLGAVLQKAGMIVEVHDQNAPYVDYSSEYLLDRIKKFKPRLIGLRLSITAALNAYKIIKLIKDECCDVQMILGGPHATINPKEVLDAGADFVVRNEGEVVILNLIDAILNKKSVENIRGIAYKVPKGTVTVNPDELPLENLDILPLPAKTLFKKEDYVRRPNDLKNFACIFTSRDCPGKCTFCAAPVLGKQYRYRSASSVLAEIRYLHDNYGITDFIFMDDAFTVNKSRIEELCNSIKHDLGFKISFSCNSTIYHADRDVLKLLKETGCTDIIYGVERIDLESQRKIRKGYKIERVTEVLNDTVDVGLGTCVNFMFGFPWERKELIDENFKFIKKYFKKVHFNMTGVVVPYPGSELYGQVKDIYNIKEWWLQDPPRLIDNERPFFRRKVLCDDSIIENNFFNYTSAIKRQIRGVYWWITWNNARCSYRNAGVMGFMKAVAAFSLYRLSWFLYMISPKLEKKIFGLIGVIINKVT